MPRKIGTEARMSTSSQKTRRGLLFITFRSHDQVPYFNRRLAHASQRGFKPDATSASIARTNTSNTLKPTRSQVDSVMSFEK